MKKPTYMCGMYGGYMKLEHEVGRIDSGLPAQN